MSAPDVIGPTMLPAIKDLQRVDLQPGDVVVVTVENMLGARQRDSFEAFLGKSFDGHRVVLIAGFTGLRATVWNEAQEPILVTMANALQRLETELQEIRALLIEADDEPGADLEGRPAGAARDQSGAL